MTRQARIARPWMLLTLVWTLAGCGSEGDVESSGTFDAARQGEPALPAPFLEA